MPDVGQRVRNVGKIVCNGGLYEHKSRLAEELKIELWQVEAAVKLIDEGNTIPFISRYRKEVTGSLNDEVLRKLSERLTYLRNLEDKKKQVLASIEEQGKLTDELREKIQAAETLVVVEGSVSPVSSKEKNESDNRKRKRTGTTGKHDSVADDKENAGRGSKCVY